MSETSEELNLLLESLGIRDGDPILKQEFGGDMAQIRESESKDDEEWCDSLNSDDIGLDAFRDYGPSSPRTEKQRRQRDRNAYCSHAAAAARSVSSRSKHRIASRCASLPLTPLKMPENHDEDTANKPLPHHKSFRHKKRSQDLQRSYERQCKFRLEDPSSEIITSAPNFDDEADENGRCESLPPMLALKVATHSRYMSVLSRKIGNKEWLCSRKISTTGLPQDRVSFYAHMVGLLKYNSQEHSLQLDPKRSEEEVLYQQEINEMIWLELQAWHIGQDTLAYDNFLLEQRQKVKVIYNQVMSFTFTPTLKEESKSEATRVLPFKERKSSFFDTSSTDLSGQRGKICSGCLSVWCLPCHEKESEALDKVWNLLDRVDQIRCLFPSSRKLCQFFPSWKEDKFNMRHEALCLWFNITSQLRFVIGLLGRRLSLMTKDLIPWPVFSESKSGEQKEERSPTQSINSRDSGSHSMEDSLEQERGIKRKPSGEVHEDRKSLPNASVVRFEIENLDESVDSSNPSQSPGSSDLNSASCSSHSPFEFTGRMSSDHLTPPLLSHSLRRCSSDIFMEANPYRTYVEKLLRNKGMKKTLDKVAEVIRDVMSRTICIIEESHSLQGEKEIVKVENDFLGVNPHPLSAFQEELRKHPDSNWMSKFSSLGLPLFHTQFLFLASIPLHMMRECLKLRLEQMPLKPSRMSIKQLMSEYKEAVKFAVMVRQKFVKWCGFLLVDLPPPLATNLESRKCQAIEELDANVKKMLEVYLEWLDQFVLMMHRETQVAGLQRNFLQEEWCFVQSTCPHVTDGESLAATRFCNIACHMLCSVGDFLDTGLDDMICDLQASALDRVAEEGQSDATDDAFEMEDEDYEAEEEEEEEEQEGGGEGKSCFQRKKLVLRCRSLQELIGEARERALRAVALAKMLKLDLEVAVEAKEILDSAKLFLSLLDTKHILVKGHSLKNLVIFVPETLEKCPEEILSILQIQIGGSSDKYLILLNLPPEEEQHWLGQSVHMSLNADCAIALSRVQVSGLMLIVKDGSQLQKVRRRLADAFRGILVFDSQIAPHKVVTQTLFDMKNEAQQLCKVLEKSISDMEDLVNISQFFPHADEECGQLSHLVRDTLHQGFLFGFEYHKEVARLVSGRQRSELAPLLIGFGRHWMKFVRMHYTVGKGSRPRWAVPGFDFLLFICDPHNTSQMSVADFKTLRTEVEECREYIIGSTHSDSSSPSTPLIVGRPFRSQSSNSSLSHPPSQTNSPSANYTDSPKFRRSLLRYANQASFDKSEDGDSSVREHPMECVREAIEALERRIEEQRFRDSLIGRVSEHNRDLIEIKPHTVSFSWHRGFKIGAGHFGKVYTAVNNNNGELMAMKILPLQPNDHRSIKKVANELKTFERINHPNLVNYYGIEIHNDEMLMFMEYCDEGTLEALAASTEGLPEEIVRKYTRQLLSAVHTMHENGIVHRDIKGANIFLAKEGNTLKLGDFGCAVRLRGLQTEVNELSGIVGTHAYMAPEIFRSNEGHGRAADIWSVGCVVIEMITGKRPWPQYDSSVQIMFQVGSGKSPPVPDSLSEEGDHFLGLCFIHSPKERATAARLLDHTFVKVEEEENVSLPLFSLNPAVHLRRPRTSSGDTKAS